MSLYFEYVLQDGRRGRKRDYISRAELPMRLNLIGIGASTAFRIFFFFLFSNISPETPTTLCSFTLLNICSIFLTKQGKRIFVAPCDPFI